MINVFFLQNVIVMPHIPTIQYVTQETVSVSVNRATREDFMVEDNARSVAGMP